MSAGNWDSTRCASRRARRWARAGTSTAAARAMRWSLDKAHSVAVTLADGRVQTFDLVITPSSSVLVPFSTVLASFVPRPGRHRDDRLPRQSEPADHRFAARASSHCLTTPRSIRSIRIASATRRSTARRSTSTRTASRRSRMRAATARRSDRPASPRLQVRASRLPATPRTASLRSPTRRQCPDLPLRRQRQSRQPHERGRRDVDLHLRLPSQPARRHRSEGQRRGAQHLRRRGPPDREHRRRRPHGHLRQRPRRADTTITDRLGHVTVLAYDADGNVTSSQRSVTIAGTTVLASTTSTYDSYEQPVH